MSRNSSRQSVSPFASLEKSSTTASNLTQQGKANIGDGRKNMVLGGLKAGWNVGTAPIHALGAFGAGTLKGGVGVGAKDAWNAVKTDMQDIGQGVNRAAGGVGQTALGVGQRAGGAVVDAAMTPVNDVRGLANGMTNASRNFNNTIAGGVKAGWNVGTAPIHALGAFGAGTLKGGVGVGAKDAWNAVKTDMQDIGQGVNRAFGGGGQTPAAAAAPGNPSSVIPFAKTAFAKLAVQAPTLLANAGAAGQAYPANRGAKMDDVNKWIGQAGPQLPDRPGTHRRALAPAAKPSRIGDMPVLGSDTPAGKGMTMTGPGAGAAAGVPAVSQGAPADLSDRFRKYHGTSYNPKSSMDQGKMQQMQKLYKTHGDKLTAQHVYDRQYNKGPEQMLAKSSALSAFNELEKQALAGWLQKGFGWGAQRLGSSAHKARVALKGRADDAATTAYDAAIQARKGQRGMAGIGIAEENARRASKGVMDSAGQVGKRRSTLAGALNQAGDKISTSPGLQHGINYGIPTVGGAGLLYGANRMGHSGGRESGFSDGWDSYGAASQGLTPDSPGYFGNLMSAITGQNPGDAAAVRNMLDERKSDIMQAILSGRA